MKESAKQLKNCKCMVCEKKYGVIIFRDNGDMLCYKHYIEEQAKTYPYYRKIWEAHYETPNLQ